MFDEPIFFKPLFFERVWGGNNLEALFGKELPAGKTIGESWELSDRPEAQSVVDGGAFHGWTLRQLIEAHPVEALGNLSDKRRFPLLAKYVDAGDDLSVQVHPDDLGAKLFDDLGKSECWVIVHAEPGAQVVRGLKQGTTREAFARAVEENRVAEVLHFFEPKVGDVIALPAGMVHAIGKGLVVAEIQQNSDVTLRIHDYNRMGLDGRPRKLHIKEALDAIRFDGKGDEFEGDMSLDTIEPRKSQEINGVEELLDGKYFSLIRITLSDYHQHGFLGGKEGGKIPHPMVAMVLSGEGEIGTRAVKAGMTCLIPAYRADVHFATKGKMTVLLATPE